MWNLPWKGGATVVKAAAHANFYPLSSGAREASWGFAHVWSAHRTPPQHARRLRVSRATTLSACEVQGTESENPRGPKECQLVRKEVDEKNTQPARLKQRHVTKALISEGLIRARV